MRTIHINKESCNKQFPYAHNRNNGACFLIMFFNIKSPRQQKCAIDSEEKWHTDYAQCGYCSARKSARIVSGIKSEM